MEFISVKISDSLIHAFSAILHSTGNNTIQEFFINNHDSNACSYVGIIFNSRSVSIFVFIQIGFIQIKNKIVKITNANTKFIKTHARIIIICFQADLFTKAFLSFLSFNNSLLSHLSLTKPQRGNQFKLYKVHFLSLNNFFALGGIQSQNSSTFTQKNLAAEKCHNSCIITIVEKSNIETIIQSIIIFSFGFKAKMFYYIISRF
jgi:hypothetical protein